MRLDLICRNSKDVEDVFNYVLVTPARMVASNGCSLAVIPTDEVLHEEAIDGLGNEGFLVHVGDYKKFITFERFEWVGLEAIKGFKTGARPQIVEVLPTWSELSFPDFDQVIPDDANTCKISDISIDANLLSNLQKALGFPALCLKFFPGFSPVKIVDPEGRSARFGIVKPCDYS